MVAQGDELMALRDRLGARLDATAATRRRLGIPHTRRKIRLARCILAEGRLPPHQSRPVPHATLHRMSAPPASLMDFG